VELFEEEAEEADKDLGGESFVCMLVFKIVVTGGC